jgi:hypothetical protein
MKKSPLNFGALAGAASSISARLAGGVGGPTNLAAILGGGIFGKRRGKGMRGRVQKLENQMGVLMRDRNKNAADEAMDVGPGELTVGGEPVSAAQNPSVSATQDSLTPMNSFTPGTAEAAKQMFGNEIPGSFDRSMEENPLARHKSGHEKPQWKIEQEAKFEAEKAAHKAEKARLLEITRKRREKIYGTDQSSWGK